MEYAYDAWGNHNAYAETGYEWLATRNPIRYRGYYYDSGLGLYYLNSRYYDPETGRFINADDVSELDFETVNGLNLYAYCLNNPVMLKDSSGNKPLPWWAKLLIGIGIIVGTALFVAAIVASAGAVGALAGIGAASLGFSAGTVSAIATAFTIGTYVVAAGVGLFGLNDAVTVWSGTNLMHTYVFGGNETAYNVTKGVFNALGTVATLAGTFGPKILRKAAKGGKPSREGFVRSFNDKNGNWSARIDATVHGNPKPIWHHNPHVHFGQINGKGSPVYYFWEAIRRLFGLK